METVLITGCSSGYGLETAAPLPFSGLERGRHHANAARRGSSPIETTPRTGARCDEAREHCVRA
jgi:NAD(P)-dependent dehydrogenase (short-subunit alcohol dehydrogenase family)